MTGIVTDTGRASRAAAPARRAVLLGLRRRRRPTSTSRCTARWRTATRSAYKDADLPHRRTSSSAAPAHPACSSSGASCSTNRVPDVPGGGTVAYVNPEDHRYLTDPAHREEGGTPAIIESIRAGLVFQLKRPSASTTSAPARSASCAGPSRRGSRSRPSRSSATSRPSGSRSSRSSSAAPAGRYLHHNFVVALLNDLFGIQSRGGCSCAGPYGHRLLGIDLERSHEFEREITRGCEGIKPGWVRVNFNYFISETVFDYVLEAVRLVARDGWRLLGDYGSTRERPLAAPRRPGRAAAAAAPGRLRRRAR